ncbi:MULTISPECIES: OmpA family protein [Prevotella]|jgi:OOP family OmpA-OmpF porin|uniref:OmpA family protein n=1 Tax=Prevotella TaxID=838 RepID=UPI00033F9681|nr:MULTISPECIES: OmpA family protein [Prevotella]MCI6488782.1 OmpA family protein [Prevotella sp.]MDD7597139.1 OmpA family protein [Prevotellaceae bacterium]KIP59202.1 OmpA family protein [Prevotella pectinovora]MCI6048061.1 OmpA family protein [Prevotella pectinovora]MDD7743223.1 OmpA family protein [Prevotella pectinovora]
MKKFLIMLAIAGVSLTSMAQETETTTEKYSVATNSFWSNWFVQGGVQWTAFYSSLEHGFDTSNNPLKSFRSNPQASVAIGKWFTPGLGLRTKVSGIWGKANGDSFKYWNAQEQVLFNLSNMFCGYNPKRVYNCIPFAGAGFARNMSSDMYAMGMSIGLLNEFNINKRVAINLELGWNRLENDFYSEGHANNGPRGWDSHDNYLYAELGLTLNIGKTGWAKVPDVDAIKALSQSQIDALNAQLADSKSENERLKAMLNEKPKEVAMPESIKQFITTPVSVFFNIGKTDVANPKDLVNVEALAKYAKTNNSKIMVTGFADSATGTPQINQKLSVKRAEIVKGELIKMGVPADNISTQAHGGVETLSPISFNRRATVQITEQ